MAEIQIPEKTSAKRRVFRTRFFRNSSTYRNGSFFIGQRLIEKYYPDKGEVFLHGVVFNATSGNFECWKAGKRLSVASWKVGQKTLVHWAKVNTGLDYEKAIL